MSKEQEASISSLGIAGKLLVLSQFCLLIFIFLGSFYGINGLTMDLGGGSVELNYVNSNKNCDNPAVETSSTPVSSPYGAVIMKNSIHSF